MHIEFLSATKRCRICFLKRESDNIIIEMGEQRMRREREKERASEKQQIYSFYSGADKMYHQF